MIQSLVAISILFLLSLWTSWSKPQARQFYVAVGGSDTAAGTESAPWGSINKACATVGAGDTVFVRGGTYRDQYCHGSANGTATAPITLKAYPNERPVMTGNPTFGVFLNLFGNYWVLDGINTENTAVNSVVINVQGQGTILRNFSLKNNAGDTMIRLLNASWVTVENYRMEITGNPAEAGSGDHMYIMGSHHVLVRNGYHSKAGHAAIDMMNSAENMSHHVILKNLIIEQHWGGGLYAIRGTTDTLVEDIVVRYIGEEVHYSKAALQPAGQNGIWRRISIERSGVSQVGLTLAGYTFSGIVQNAINNRLYNITVYRAHNSAVMMVQKDKGNITQNKVLNSIFYRNKVGGNADPPYWPQGNQYIAADTYMSDVQWAEFPNGNYFLGNIILHADASGDKPGEPRMVFIQHKTGNSAWSVTQANTDLAPYFVGNREVNPKFTDAEGSNFTLATGSPAIDTGVPLARTTASGTNTDRLLVDDPYSFSDGMGMIPGDAIRVNGVAATVETVDLAGKVLTLTAPISFPSGARVDQNYSGAGPDVGAFEVGLSSPAPTPESTPQPLPTPTPTPSPVPASPNGTKGVTVVDSSNGVWTLGVNGETLRNGTHMAGGLGTVYLWLNQAVYVLGTDQPANWYRWSGMKWELVGASEPMSSASPEPTPAASPVTSPSATPTPVSSPSPLPSPTVAPSPTPETKIYDWPDTGHEVWWAEITRMGWRCVPYTKNGRTTKAFCQRP